MFFPITCAFFLCMKLVLPISEVLVCPQHSVNADLGLSRIFSFFLNISISPFLYASLHSLVYVLLTSEGSKKAQWEE